MTDSGVASAVPVVVAVITATTINSPTAVSDGDWAPGDTSAATASRYLNAILVDGGKVNGESVPWDAGSMREPQEAMLQRQILEQQKTIVQMQQQINQKQAPAGQVKQPDKKTQYGEYFTYRGGRYHDPGNGNDSRTGDPRIWQTNFGKLKQDQCGDPLARALFTKIGDKVGGKPFTPDDAMAIYKNPDRSPKSVIEELGLEDAIRESKEFKAEKTKARHNISPEADVEKTKLTTIYNSFKDDPKGLEAELKKQGYDSSLDFTRYKQVRQALDNMNYNGDGGIKMRKDLEKAMFPNSQAVPTQQGKSLPAQQGNFNGSRSRGQQAVDEVTFQINDPKDYWGVQQAAKADREARLHYLDSQPLPPSRHHLAPNRNQSVPKSPSSRPNPDYNQSPLTDPVAQSVTNEASRVNKEILREQFKTQAPGVPNSTSFVVSSNSNALQNNSQVQASPTPQPAPDLTVDGKFKIQQSLAKLTQVKGNHPDQNYYNFFLQAAQLPDPKQENAKIITGLMNSEFMKDYRSLIRNSDLRNKELEVSFGPGNSKTITVSFYLGDQGTMTIQSTLDDTGALKQSARLTRDNDRTVAENASIQFSPKDGSLLVEKQREGFGILDPLNGNKPVRKREQYSVDSNGQRTSLGSQKDQAFSPEIRSALQSQGQIKE